MDGTPSRQRRVRGTPRTPRTPSREAPSSSGARSEDVPATSPPIRRTPRRGVAARRSGINQPSSSVGYATETSSVLRTPQTHHTGSVGPTPVPTGRIGRLGVPQTPMSISRSDIRGTTTGAPVTEQASDIYSTTTGMHTRGDGVAQRAVIFGTNVSVQESQQKFADFFEQYPEDSDVKKYMEKLSEMSITGVMNINLDCKDLQQWREPGLFSQLITYPQEVIPLCDLALNEIYEQLCHENDIVRPIDAPRVQVRVFGIPDKHGVRELGPSDLNHLVCIRGMITRLSPIIPDMRMAFFRCVVCKVETEVLNDRGRITEPQRCPNQNCGAQKSQELVHNRCTFANKQLIRMQEAPESMPEGETPQTVSLFVFEDLCDVPKPGDRVEVTGIYRASPMRLSQSRRTVSTTFKTWFDVIHIRKSDSERISAEAPHESETSDYYTPFDESTETKKISEEKEAQLREMGAQPDIVDRLIKSLAPSIWEMDEVKMGLLVQLFGGVNRTFEHSENRLRGEINVLLVGDPATAKSQLLQYVHKISPRGVYTSGRGSSGVGLTAYVARDPETNDFVLESGALVVSDRGICCIDEFDKMTKDARAMLHEAMEQQTISIAKAGIIATLNARTAILAAANPVASRYNSAKSIVENINLPPTLLSRFDLIFLVLDRPDEKMDKRLARHVISLQYKNPDVAMDIDVSQLSDYISFARRTIQPAITDEVVLKLAETYRDMRRMAGGDEHHKTVSATPRQLESLIRIAEAFARMQLRNVVTIQDVDNAYLLIRNALRRAATNPRTGLVDMDMITTGTSTYTRRLNDSILSDGVLSDVREPIGQFKEKLKKHVMDVSDEDLHIALRELAKAKKLVIITSASGAITKVGSVQD